MQCFSYNLLKAYFKEALTNVDMDAFNLSYLNVVFKSIWNFNWMDTPIIST